MGGTSERNRQIFLDHEAGDTYPQIAQRHGVKRQRIHQIVVAQRRAIAEATRLMDELVASKAAAVERLAGLLEARAEIDRHIRTVRAELIVLDEELQSREIDRILGLN